MRRRTYTGQCSITLENATEAEAREFFTGLEAEDVSVKGKTGVLTGWLCDVMVERSSRGRLLLPRDRRWR